MVQLIYFLAFFLKNNWYYFYSFVMMCTSIVGYFSYSSWIVVIYGIITFTILIESIDNQKQICLLPDDYDLKGDINKLCEQRLLFNFTSVSSDFRRHNINIHFTTDSNYFIVPCLYGFHILVILGTTAISPHLLPISFCLLNKSQEHIPKNGIW